MRRAAAGGRGHIERAIAKGTGEGADTAAIQPVTYEGYGPGGVALLIDTLTDNRNRTGSDVRHLLTKHGGTLGEPGSVAYLFEKRGVVVVDAERFGEDDLMPAIDAGAQDIQADQDVLEVVTAPADLSAVRSALEADEAMARGRPVVATRRGGSGEYLRDGGNCLLFEADDPRELATTLQRLASDPALRARLRSAGLETAARHTAPAFNAAAEEAVMGALGSAASQSPPVYA